MKYLVLIVVIGVVYMLWRNARRATPRPRRRGRARSPAHRTW